MFVITTQTENAVILSFGDQRHSMRMTRVLSGQPRQHKNHKHFIIEQSRINCTQPHRKDKDCQKSWPWTKAQLTLVALLPSWMVPLEQLHEQLNRNVLFMRYDSERWSENNTVLDFWFEDTNSLLLYIAASLAKTNTLSFKTVNFFPEITATVTHLQWGY